ncbi:MAG: hypothetical protein V4617_16305 [Gemmatimonadota bacterium]
MPRRLVAPLAAVFATLLAACAPDTILAPADGADLVAPSAVRAAASGGGAVRVSEYGSLFYIVTNDAQRQLTSTLGATLAVITAECNGMPIVGDQFSYRTLTTPSGKVLEHAQAEDVTVLVFDGYYDFATDLCAFVERTPLLAVGTADYVLTSNNFFSPDAPGASEDNVRAQGTVTKVGTGELLHYVVRSGSLVTGGGIDKGYSNNIMLTPMKR